MPRSDERCPVVPFKVLYVVWPCVNLICAGGQPAPPLATFLLKTKYHKVEISIILKLATNNC